MAPSLLPGFPSIIFAVNVMFNQVFNENQVIVMLKSAAGVRASSFGFRSITLVCFGLLTPNLLWVAYIKAQLGIATQVSVIKVKVTVTKNRNSVFGQ